MIIIIIITITIIIKRQFIECRIMAIYSHYKGAVQCSLLVLVLWKQFISEVGT